MKYRYVPNYMPPRSQYIGNRQSHYAFSKKKILAYRYYFTVTGTCLNFDGYSWQGRASLGTSYLRDVIRKYHLALHKSQDILGSLGHLGK